MDLPPVDELEDKVHLRLGDVPHDDDGALGARLVEDPLEVSGAGGEHHPVGSKGAAFAGQGHVHEELLVQELVKEVPETLDVGVPAEPEDAGRGRVIL